uniref:Uncharacterized protein TCIL3000_2_170 n=1 Tax=Trypanosoma congolense (strain IL3000) TaxID=1068625 RepID=G0UJ99_TRYCI|nr:unnamed protein product [Trypanosoma congolense IL3000]
MYSHNSESNLIFSFFFKKKGKSKNGIKKKENSVENKQKHIYAMFRLNFVFTKVKYSETVKYIMFCLLICFVLSSTLPLTGFGLPPRVPSNKHSGTSHHRCTSIGACPNTRPTCSTFALYPQADITVSPLFPHHYLIVTLHDSVEFIMYALCNGVFHRLHVQARVTFMNLTNTRTPVATSTVTCL